MRPVFFFGAAIVAGLYVMSCGGKPISDGQSRSEKPGDLAVEGHGDPPRYQVATYISKYRKEELLNSEGIQRDAIKSAVIAAKESGLVNSEDIIIAILSYPDWGKINNPYSIGFMVGGLELNAYIKNKKVDEDLLDRLVMRIEVRSI